jgi:hypothetical protein
LRDDQDVAAFETDCSSARGVHHTFDKIVTMANLGNSWKGKDPQLQSCGRGWN